MKCSRYNCDNETEFTQVTRRDSTSDIKIHGDGRTTYPNYLQGKSHPIRIICKMCGMDGTPKDFGMEVKTSPFVIPASPRVICVIHDQGDWISTWLVETEPDADPLEAIHKELFKGDEDWDVYIKDDIEWFYLDPIAAMTLKDIEWPETFRDDQTFEHNTVMAALYRAFKVGGEETDDPKES